MPRRALVAVLALTGLMRSAPAGAQEGDAKQIGRERAAPAAEVGATDRPKLVLATGGFTTAVSSLDFSPDGRWLAAAGADKTVRIWELATGRVIATLRGQDEAGPFGICTALAFSPDRRALLVGVRDFTPEGTLRVYDTADLGRVAALLPVHPQGGVVDLAFSDDSQYLASVGSEGKLIVWDWPQRRQRWQAPVQGAVTYLGFPLKGLPFLALIDGQGPHLFSALSGKNALTLTPQEFQEILAQQGDQQALFAFLQRMVGVVKAFGEIQNPYGSVANKARTYLDTGQILQGGMARREGRDRYWVALWSAASGAQPVRTYEGHNYLPTALALSPDGTRVASGDFLGNIHIWGAATGQLQVELTGAGRPVYRVSFSASGDRLAFGTTPHPRDRWTYNSYSDPEAAFDLKNRRILDDVSGDFRPEVTRQGERAISLRFEAQTAQFFVDCTRAGQRESSYLVEALPMCYSLLHSQAPGFADPVVIGEFTGELDCFDPRTMMVRRQFTGHLGAVTSVSESPDGRFLASSSTDRTIRIWSLERFQSLGWPDFYIADDGKARFVIPGGPSARAGIQAGDRLHTVDGMDITTGIVRYVQGRWPFKPGQRVPLELDRNGQTYQIEVELRAGPDLAEPLLNLFTTADGEWVLWTPQGYYDASLGGDRLIGWHLNQGRDKAAKFYLAQQFRKPFFRPDVIDRVLQASEVARAVELANAARPHPVEPLDIRQLGTIGRLEPPRVHILAPAEGAVLLSGRATVRAEVEAQNDRPIRSITVLVNGRPVGGKDIAREGPGAPAAAAGRKQVVAREVELLPGRNELSVVAANDAATSQPATVAVSYEAAEPPASRPNLYLLAVGISKYANPEFNLQFPDRDAEDFAASWKGQQGAVYEEVQARVLTNDRATTRAILEGMDWLVRSATQRDVAVLFLSAHGVRDERQNYYLATHEIDPKSLRSTGLRWGEIQDLIRDLPCKFLLFADTCHSGGITGAKAMGSDDPLRELVSAETGAVVFASSLPREVSLEDPKWGHGAFTRALLDVLTNPATDLDRDGYLSLSELDHQVARRVKELTEGRQHTAVNRPPTVSDFNFYKTP